MPVVRSDNPGLEIALKSYRFLSKFDYIDRPPFIRFIGVYNESKTVQLELDREFVLSFSFDQLKQIVQQAEEELKNGV